MSDKYMAVATTGRKTSAASIALAEASAARLNIPYIARGRASIDELKKEYGVDFVLVAKKGLLTLDTPAGELFFHPNMAHLRLKNLRFGDGDRMVEALGLAEGMSVLDCTLGFGADAIVAAAAVGASGRVVGVEVSPLIEAVVHYGLANYTGDTENVTAPMRRITTVCADALDYLRAQPDDSFDAIYFDPMFRHPFMESASLTPLRTVADGRALTADYIAEARRVARRRVVMKETSLSTEFARLGFDKITGGKYSKVHYGVIELS